MMSATTPPPMARANRRTTIVLDRALALSRSALRSSWRDSSSMERATAAVRASSSAKAPIISPRASVAASIRPAATCPEICPARAWTLSTMGPRSVASSPYADARSSPYASARESTAAEAATPRALSDVATRLRSRRSMSEIIAWTRPRLATAVAWPERRSTARCSSCVSLETANRLGTSSRSTTTPNPPRSLVRSVISVREARDRAYRSSEAP